MTTQTTKRVGLGEFTVQGITTGAVLKNRGHNGGGLGAAFGGGIEFALRKMDGESTSSALGGAAIEALKWFAFSPVMEVKMALDFVGSGLDMIGIPTLSKTIERGKENLARISTNPGEARFGRNFQDTEQSHTLRQRNMQAIQESRLNARSVLGNEARMLHR